MVDGLAVDGFHVANAGDLAQCGEFLRRQGKPFETTHGRNLPCTPSACIELLDHAGVDLASCHAVVLGRSNIVGLPLALMLMHRNATVTVCHSHTHNIEQVGTVASCHWVVVTLAHVCSGLQPGGRGDCGVGPAGNSAG